MTRSLCRRTGLLMVVWASIGLAGCAGFKQRVDPLPPVERAQPTPPPEHQAPRNLPTAHYRQQRFYVHEVRWPDETLERIAQWYTGRGANWKALLRATPNLRRNRIRQGDVVFIPIDMLQIETPMPKQYVQQRHPPAAASAPAGPSGRNETPPQPYGPRPYPQKTNP